MSLTPAYTASNIIGSPQTIRFSDTSTGSDAAIVKRRIYLTDYAGNPVVPTGTTTDYIEWSIGDTTIDVDVLDKDMALNSRVEWLNVSNVVVVETEDRLQGYTGYNELFYFSLTQAQAMQNQPPPMIMQDSLYYESKMKLRVLIDSGNQAVVEGNDIVSAQNMYDAATYMVLNENKYF